MPFGSPTEASLPWQEVQHHWSAEAGKCTGVVHPVRMLHWSQHRWMVSENNGGDTPCLLTTHFWLQRVVFNSRHYHRHWSDSIRCIAGCQQYRPIAYWLWLHDAFIFIEKNYKELEMWANAQRDGRPAQYRWRPLFNTAKFSLCPLLDCHAVTLPRRKTRWNLQGCPKLANRSQPLMGQSSPYCEDMWGRYCCLTSFFPLSIRALVAKI